MRIEEKGFELSASPAPKPPMAHQIIGGPWAAFLFGPREPRFVTYASFVLGTLVVLVIAFSRPSGYCAGFHHHRGEGLEIDVESGTALLPEIKNGDE